MSEVIVNEVTANIFKVTIQRPESMNALNASVLNELFKTFTFGLSKTARGVYITGAGKAFVAGADIASMRGLNAIQAKELCDLGHKTMNAIESFHAPVVACVNGFALGGGLELALACDFIYAVKSAKMGLPEVNLGLFPGFGGTQRLARSVSVARARELIYSAEVFTAEQGLEWGLVNKLCDAETLESETLVLLTKIARKAPLAVAKAKKAILAPFTGIDGMDFERGLFPSVFATKDAQIGVEAFLNKKTAEFSGE